MVQEVSLLFVSSLKMDSNHSGEDLVKMSFMNLKTEVCLTDAEQMCKHNVKSIDCKRDGMTDLQRSNEIHTN